MSLRGTSYYEMAIDGGATSDDEREQLAQEAERLHRRIIEDEEHERLMDKAYQEMMQEEAQREQ